MAGRHGAQTRKFRARLITITQNVDKLPQDLSCVEHALLTAIQTPDGTYKSSTELGDMARVSKSSALTTVNKFMKHIQSFKQPSEESSKKGINEPKPNKYKSEETIRGVKYITVEEAESFMMEPTKVEPVFHIPICIYRAGFTKQSTRNTITLTFYLDQEAPLSLPEFFDLLYDGQHIGITGVV